jgi:hypothetical protein
MRIFTRPVLAFLLASATFTLGQSAPAPAAPPQTSAEPQVKASRAYRLEYTLYEIEDGKRVNTRTYKVELTDHGKIKSGSRVPVLTGNTNSPNTRPQYIDVGLIIDSRIKMSDDQLFLATNIEMRGIVPDPSGQGTTPVVRSNGAESNVIVTLGKAILLASIDDPLSNRRYEMEVKVTQL